MDHLRLALVGLSSFGIAAIASGQLINDNFDTDTSADYTVVQDDGVFDASPADSTITYAFDYSTLGIPSAPNSAGGTTLGLRMTANDTDNGTGNGEEDGITAFHNTGITGNHTLFVDIWMEVDLAASGTTEYAHVGIGGDGVSQNRVFTPILGSGSFLAMTGDGGSGSSDYRYFTPEITTVPTSDPSYLAGTGNAQGNALYESIYPGGDFTGSPGNRWTTMRIDVDANNDRVTYSLDGVMIIRADTAAADGFVSLGYADVFDSIGPHSVIYDNLRVIPAPGSLALLAVGGLVLRRRR